MSLRVFSGQISFLAEAPQCLSYIKRMLRAGLLSLLVVTISGCFLSSASKDPVEEEKLVLDRAVGNQPDATPFTLDVVDEANDGHRLIIKGRLLAKREWPTKDVALRLSALDEQGESRIIINRLSDVLPQVSSVTPSSPANFTLAIPSVGLSNYQLEVLWGSEAAGLSSDPSMAANSEGPSPQTLVLRGLEVHRLPDSSCASPDECRVKFTITGEFFNSGLATIGEVSLIAGFSDADKLDLADQILENERQVEVRNMKLAPGAAKPFRLALDILVPPSQQMAPRPVIRIMSVKTE